MTNNGKNQGEIAKARGMLGAQKARLQQVRDAIEEKKAEKLDLDLRHHKLEGTGDINKMMVLKSRSTALGKSIADLSAAEAEGLTRVRFLERYLETLDRKSESLHRESDSLNEKLAIEESFEVKAKLQTLISRLKMQIEALEG
jgi:hypothetical protein